jgi:hypothetical protein
MKRLFVLGAGIALASAALAAGLHGGIASPSAGVSPIYGVPLPDGYRQWELIAPALEDAPLDEIRAVVGNKTAVDAYRAGRLPFPDGSILVKLAWKRQRSAVFPSATVPGAATTVQVMVKDSRRYAASGGWGYGRFVAGKPVDEAQHRTCLSCHEARAKEHDDVFTHYAL